MCKNRYQISFSECPGSSTSVCPKPAVSVVAGMLSLAPPSTEHDPQFVLNARDLPGVSHGPSVARGTFSLLCLADSMRNSVQRIESGTAALIADAFFWVDLDLFLTRASVVSNPFQTERAALKVAACIHAMVWYHEESTSMLASQKG